MKCGSWEVKSTLCCIFFFFFSSRRRHTRCASDWSSDVCSSDLGGMRTIFKALTNPDTPVNEGGFRPLRVICPEGNVFSAVRPAPVSTYWETLLNAVDLVWKALAPHMPERMTAGHFLSVCGLVLSGPHADTGELAILVEPQAGGWGAGFDKDGESGLVCIGDGETYVIPVEVCEQKYGILVDQYALLPEDAGAGEF